MSHPILWSRYQEHLCHSPELGLTLDLSRMRFADDFFAVMEPTMRRAFAAMVELEAGAIANPDEGRRVGHYWLRRPDLAPDAEISAAIEAMQSDVRRFSKAIHKGEVVAQDGAPFTDLLVIGIGGSALGPQFVSEALGSPSRDKMKTWFFDNTDPEGMARTLEALGDSLPHTLCLVVSKSGGTPETRNGMLVAETAFKARGLSFAKHAVAITGEGSKLDQKSRAEGWLERFPMWDWVGGRTSETAAVGLLPAALQGIDIDALLDGAARCDALTSRPDIRNNPAARLALMWYYATNGKGEKDMVILPYKDRLLLFSRYLQQLIMESLGKGEDLTGAKVAQGIAVYGNKGSTDQHAYVQQLREGINNFFVTFIEVREHGGTSIEVEPGVTAGDYLHGFMRGTRQALYENGRESMTLTIDKVSPFHVGVLIALYERAVGYYASLVGINAYHQPGVEAGKRAAAKVLDLQKEAMRVLEANPEEAMSAPMIAAKMGAADRVEAVFHVLRNLGISRPEIKEDLSSPSPAAWTWQLH